MTVPCQSIVHPPELSVRDGFTHTSLPKRSRWKRTKRRREMIGRLGYALCFAGIAMISNIIGKCEAYSSPNEVTFGGFFDLFSGANDYFQLEMQSAFVMAVNEINARSDILPNTTILTMLSSGGDFSLAVDHGLLMRNSNGLNLTASFSGLPNLETSGLLQIFADSKTVQVNSLATDPMFEDATTYPYKIQTTAVDSYQGKVIQNIMCNYFNYTRAVIFAGESTLQLDSIIELTDATFCNIDILATYTFPSYRTDFRPELQNALDTTDATIFILFMDSVNGAMIMEQGTDIGLFREQTQIFASISFMNVDFFDHFTPNADIPNIMKGVILVEYYPQSYFIEKGDRSYFVKSWHDLPNTVNNCSTAVDSVGYHYLFPNGNIRAATGCVGLNFSHYDVNGSDINPYAALTYDAVYVLAKGITWLLEQELDVNGDNLLQAIYDLPPFYGATGIQDYSPGNPRFSNYGRGDRVDGHTYRIKNFNADGFLSGYNTSFVQVALWSHEKGFHSCDITEICESIIYNTPDNSIPSCYPPYSYAYPPQFVKLGALFCPVDSAGNIDLVQIENLAAFILAIDAINNKTDGIFDNLLPNTQIVFSFRSGAGYAGGIAAADSVTKAFNGIGIVGVVNGLTNLEVTLDNELFKDHALVQSHSMAQDSNLGTANSFPYKVQTVPLDSFEGDVLQEMICNFYGYRKLTIFATDDDLGSLSSSVMQNGRYCTLNLLSIHSFLPDTTDFTDIISGAKLAGAQIFVFFMEARNAAYLLEQGYVSGLFHEGTQIFLCSYASTYELFLHFTTASPVESILKGVITLEPWLDYEVYHSSTGALFLQRWANQPSTTRGLRHGKMSCDLTMDDEMASFLYTDSKNRSICAGLDFASYGINSTKVMNPFAPLTFDATLLLAHGFDFLISQGVSLNGDHLMKVLLNNISFIGATGLVKLSPGIRSESYYGRGDREEGLHYRIKAFDAPTYLVTLNDSFVDIGSWDTTHGFQKCSDQSEFRCVDMVYNTNNDQPASDTPPDIIVVLLPGERGLLISLAVLVLLVAFGIFGVIFKHQKSKLIKASQPVMLYFIIFGEVLAAIRVLIAALPISDASCISGLWFGHLAFTIVFGALLIKTWRVHRIVNNTTLKRVKITGHDVARIMLFGIMFIVIFLTVLTVVGHPHQSSTSTTTSNQTTREIRCGIVHPQIHTTLFAIEAVVLVIGARLCYAVKDVPDAINESKYIASAMTVILMMCCLVFPIVFLISLSHPIQQLIASLSFAVGALMTMAIFLGPKLLRLYIGDQENKSARNHGPSNSTGADAKIVPKSEPQKNVEAGVIYAADMLKSMSSDEKVRLCMEQINIWRASLLAIEEKNTGSGSGSNNNSSKLSGQYSEGPAVETTTVQNWAAIDDEKISLVT